VRTNALLLACCLVAAPALAQTQAMRTGTGGAAGQELPATQPVPVGALLAGAAVAGLLGAVIAAHAAHDRGSAATTTLTTTTR
jgi:hypothetical protein